MEIVCCICHKHILYVQPFDDKKVTQGMCAKCERDQDNFLAEIQEKKQRVQEYRKGINEPDGYK